MLQPLLSLDKSAPATKQLSVDHPPTIIFKSRVCLKMVSIYFLTGDFLSHECVEGRKGQVAAEVKVCIMSMQNTSPGLSLYYILSGLPQTINENIAFGTVMSKTCSAAAQKMASCSSEHIN